MVHVMQDVRRSARHGETRRMGFICRYPLLGFLAVVMGGPLLVLLAVGLGTAAVMLPVSRLLGWW